MGLAKALAVVAFLASSCGGRFHGIDSSCDFTDVSIDDEVFSRLIAKLPDDMEIGPQGYNRLLPGLEVDGPTVHGLRELRQFGPAIPYCTNGSRMVQVDLYSDGHAHFSSAWKTCSGDEGIIAIRTMLARFTVQFRVVDSAPAGVKLEFDRTLPVITKGIRIMVTRDGKFVHGMLAEIIGMLFPGILEELWGALFFQSAHKAFRMISE